MEGPTRRLGEPGADRISSAWHSRSSTPPGGRPQSGLLSTASAAGLANDRAPGRGCRHARASHHPPRLDPPYRAALRGVPPRSDRAALRSGGACRVGARPATDADRADRVPGFRLCARSHRALPLAARRATATGAPLRPATPAVAVRPPGRRPGRLGGNHGPQCRAGHRALRRPGGRSRGGHRGARRRAADHPRAGPTCGTPRSGSRHRRAAGRTAARPPGLPGRRVPALGPAPGRRISGPAGPARPRPGAAAPGAPGPLDRGSGVSAGRAAPAAAQPAARTRRRCCRPDR